MKVIEGGSLFVNEFRNTRQNLVVSESAWLVSMYKGDFDGNFLHLLVLGIK
jgi:hypothetical protein